MQRSLFIKYSVVVCSSVATSAAVRFPPSPLLRCPTIVHKLNKVKFVTFQPDPRKCSVNLTVKTSNLLMLSYKNKNSFPGKKSCKQHVNRKRIKTKLLLLDLWLWLHTQTYIIHDAIRPIFTHLKTLYVQCNTM